MDKDKFITFIEERLKMLYLEESLEGDRIQATVLVQVTKEYEALYNFIDPTGYYEYLRKPRSPW